MGEGGGKVRGEERTITLVAVRCSTSLIACRSSLVACSLWLVDLAWSLLYASLGMQLEGGREGGN